VTDSHEPTETIETDISVILLGDEIGRERIQCGSYREAIDTVKRDVSESVTAKIESRDGEIVFTSADMDIGDWENEWQRAKRRLSVDVEEHDCQYDTVGCVTDDRCVQCQMDRVQAQY
jgi:hypothetical protein